MPHATAFLHPHLHGDAFLERLHVADDADHLAAVVEPVQRGECDLQRVGIERAEAFVEEQGVDGGLVADQVGQRQCQGQADEEGLAAR